MMTKWPAAKMSNKLTLKMYVKFTLYKNHYILAIISPIFNQSFPKMVQLGLAAKASHQLICKT